MSFALVFRVPGIEKSESPATEQGRAALCGTVTSTLAASLGQLYGILVNMNCALRDTVNHNFVSYPTNAKVSRSCIFGLPLI